MTESAHSLQHDPDETLFVLAPEGLGSAFSGLGRTRLRTFILLRWLALAGQTLAIAFVSFALGFNVPVILCLSIIAAGALLNVFLSLSYQPQRLTQGWEAVMQLVFDTLQLAALIAATGGLSNPFLLLMVAPVTVAALTLSPWRAGAVALLTLGAAALMPLIALPLPWLEGEMVRLPIYYQWGHFTALAVGVAFFALSALRVSQDESRLVRALDEASVVVAREQRLSAIGAISAMTVHELGTPLATIHLVAKEMAAEFDEDDMRGEDARLIASQAERCRDILATIRDAREAEDIIHAQMPIEAMLGEAAAPNRGLGVSLIVESEPGEHASPHSPILARSPEIIHALGAFIENAVSFAETEVRAHASWTDTHMVVTIMDDGPGFAPDIMPKLGEPYVSQRGEDQVGGGDMGLGFFIAKTLIERSGGRIATRNHTPPKTGAIVQIVWPLEALRIKTVETS